MGLGLPMAVMFWISISSLGLGHTANQVYDEPVNHRSVQGPEHDLYRHIVDHYTPDSRPVKNASDTVVVTFALSLNQLLDLDEKHQVLSTSVWIYEEWRDELLVWSPEDFHHQKTLMIPASSIWLPDIFIFNAAGDTTDGFIHVNGSKVAIQNNGHVGWMVPLMVNSACAVDVTYFPYDRQTCTIKFGSWIYDINQLDIVLDASTPDLDHYVMNSEYDLENVSLSRGILDSSCCAGDGQHSMIVLQIKLKRKSLFYDYIVIAPTIMLCVLTLASFLLPCDKGEKIAIGLTVFLTLYVLQLRIADNVPDTNSTPILGVFMLVVMTFNCVSLIMATVVMNIKKRGDISQCPEVPVWLFNLCDRGLGPIVCTLWKKTIPIPLSLLEEVVEHETAFDGPEISLRNTSPLDNCHEDMASMDYDRSNTPWNKDDDNLDDDNSNDHEAYTEFRRRSSNRHVQFDTDCDGVYYATGTSPEYTDDTSIAGVDMNSQNDPGHHSLREEQEMEVLREKFKTHHPSMRNSINSSRNKGRRLEMINQSFRDSTQNGAELQNLDLTNSDGVSEIRKSNILSYPQYQDTLEGIRRRRVDGKDQSSGSRDETTTAETESFLPWAANEAPALEKARSINLRKRRWYYVAEVVDKFAFFVYLVLLTVSIFTVLFLIPVTFRSGDA